MAVTVQPDIVRLAEAALGNRHGRSFIRNVREFVTKLGTLPDAGPSEHSHEELAHIRDLSERIVAEIEDRLDDQDDPRRIQQELARTVYTIRRVLEDLYQWERHFLRAPR